MVKLANPEEAKERSVKDEEALYLVMYLVSPPSGALMGNNGSWLTVSSATGGQARMNPLRHRQPDRFWG
jgi:hypothetical protein